MGKCKRNKRTSNRKSQHELCVASVPVSRDMDRTGRWLQSRLCLGLTYFIPGQGWTGTAKGGGGGEAKCKHKDEISFLPLHSLPLSLHLSVSLYEGRHESVTALKMTDTACWSHGQEREASRCHKTAHNKHTHRYITNTHTHVHRHCEMKFQR